MRRTACAAAPLVGFARSVPLHRLPVIQSLTRTALTVPRYALATRALGPPSWSLTTSTVCQITIPGLLHPGSGHGVRNVADVPGLHPDPKVGSEHRGSRSRCAHTPRRFHHMQPHHVTVAVAPLLFAGTVSGVGGSFEALLRMRFPDELPSRCRLGRTRIVHGLCSPPRSSRSLAVHLVARPASTLPWGGGDSFSYRSGCRPPCGVAGPSPAVAPLLHHHLGSFLPAP